VQFDDGTREDLSCAPSTYGWGDDTPIGSWALFEPRRGLAEAAHGSDVDMEDTDREAATGEELPAAMREAWRERLRVLCALHNRERTSSTEVVLNTESLRKLPVAELRFVAENITAGREAVPKTRSEVIARLMKRLEMHERDGQRLPAQRKQDWHAAKNRRVEKAAVDRRRQDARTDEQRHQRRQQKGVDKVRILLRRTARPVVDARAFVVFK
jgi:hypothetical protein